MTDQGGRLFCGKVCSLIVAVAWLIVISALHAYFNRDEGPSQKIIVGYMPVISNLAAPLIDFASKDSPVYFQALKFSSFAEMAEAFRTGHIQAAFLIAPLAIIMYQQGTPLKLVYIGNRNESTLVVRHDLPCRNLLDLVGKTVAVPIRYSGHNLALKRSLREHGLGPTAIRTVEIAPPDMASALATGGIDGYFVGEPFAGKAILEGVGRRLLDVEEIWPDFICNVLIVRDELIRSHPERVQALVTSSILACLYAQQHLDETTQLVCSYWGQSREVVSFAFSLGRFRYDLYVPELGEMEKMAAEMQHEGLIQGPIDLRGMVEPRFARSAALRPPANSLRDIAMVEH